MGHDAQKPQPERDQTDESLRVERKKSDQALAEQRLVIQETADLLVERAREHADAVMDTARDKADQKLVDAGAGVRGREAVAAARELEDQVLDEERTTADAILDRERMEQARTLAALLPLEREKTDRYLLTERVRSDDALAHRDDFMGMVSHDLRNLLSAIVLHSGVVAKTASDSDEGRRTVAGMTRIQRYVARMNRLIGDLVDVVSLDAGKLAVTPTPGDAATLHTEAMEAFADAAAEKGLILECTCAEPSLLASFDHERMLQVLANLIANALKFTPRGGRIIISGERAGGRIHLCVEDNGMGIPGQMLEAVFERFWQVGKNDQRGFGLGLYISRCIVEAHGGKIWAESTLGERSTFHLTFPGAVPPGA
ncbi:MAG: HAMP domain-containing histidine kinase [Nannocystis sp.]|nr:HAMP domain-containing sensor histidine kinase [Nannocystis sp.]MBA3545343.1 HAMP domain-containing histidine kinase [Nannocystis sp.]